MREILFKGKRIDNGEWVLGYYFWSEKEKKHYMIGESVDYGFQRVEVMPETVGQYTGVKDTEDVRIFEGDIISVHQFLFDGKEWENEIEGIIEYVKGIEGCMSFGLVLTKAGEINRYMGYEEAEIAPPLPLCNFYGLHDESLKVIGNIHDKENG